MLIYVFPGSAYQIQGLLGNIAQVPAVGAKGGWGLYHILRRTMFLLLLDLGLSFSWLVPGLYIYPNLWDFFHRASSMLVSDICGRPQVCHYSVDGMVLRKFYQFQAVARLGQ